MGIRFLCPNGHKLNVKAFQAGQRGICPFCGAKFQIPNESTRPAGDGAVDADSPANEPTASPSESATTNLAAPAAEFEKTLEMHVQQGENEPAAEAPSNPTASATPVSEMPAEPGQPVSPAEPQPAAAEAVQAPASVEAAAPTPAESQGIAETANALSAADPSPAAPVPPVVATPSLDPLAENPNAVWYVRPPSGGQFGPSQADMMRAWLDEGRVSPETLVWCEGWPDWQEAASVFPQLQPAAADAPPVIGSGGGATGSRLHTPVRKRKNGPNVGLIVSLVAVILILLGFLVWVLVKDGDGGTAESADGKTVTACCIVSSPFAKSPRVA